MSSLNEEWVKLCKAFTKNHDIEVVKKMIDMKKQNESLKLTPAAESELCLLIASTKDAARKKIFKILVPHIDVMDMRPYTGYSFDPDELSG
jgi:hypothetical protein